MNTKLHAVTDENGRPIRFFMTAGAPLGDAGIAYRATGKRLYWRCGIVEQPSISAVAFGSLSSKLRFDCRATDRGYDADWFREALQNKGIKPCIPGRKSRTKSVKYDKRRYKRRNRIEIMFRRLKDWRRVATRYDRCPKVFLSAVALAATVLFWL